MLETKIRPRKEFLFIGFCYHMSLSEQTGFIFHLIKNVLRILQHKDNATDREISVESGQY
jgi:hypothetical protein